MRHGARPMQNITRRGAGASLVRRALNLGRKLRAGLTPFGENVSPEVPNDLFVAHLSIYEFSSRFTARARVLDLGSGAGYGSDLLRSRGATEVVGLDVDSRNVRYATRRYPLVRFVHGDAHRLPGDLGLFDCVVASNVLEHLNDVTGTLDDLRKMTKRLIIAVPPIVDAASLRANEAIPYHRSNLSVSRWIELLSTRFSSVTTYRHFPRTGIDPDFTNPFRSALTTADFAFEEADLLAKPTLTAIFVASM